MKPLPNKLGIIKNMFLLISSFGIALIVAEIYFRYDGTYSTYLEKYGGSYTSIYQPAEKNWYHIFIPGHLRTDGGSEFSNSFIANNEGLLDHDFVTNKKANTVRVFITGDSFIQGIGAPYDSSCPKQLENLLNAAYRNNPQFEVWNCGVGGSDPFFEYQLLQDKLLRYQPDMVILGINWTDVDDIIIRGGWERFRADSTVSYNRPPWFEPLYGKSFIVRRIVHDILGYDWILLRPQEYSEAKIESTQKIKDCLKKFHRLCATRNIPFYVVFQPGIFESPSNSTPEINKLITFCDSTGIQTVDLGKHLHNHISRSDSIAKLYWPIDGHFTSTGYTFYAQALLPVVAKHLVSKKVKPITK